MNTNTVVVAKQEILVSKHRIKNLKLAITNVLGDIIC